MSDGVSEKFNLNMKAFFLRGIGSSAKPVPWIALEDGGTSLSHLLKLKGFKEDYLFPVASQLRMALQHLHAANLAHLDVKPANVVLDVPRMAVRLIDLGMSEQVCGSDLRELRYKTYVTEPYRPQELFGQTFERKHLCSADWRPCLNSQSSKASPQPCQT